MQPKPGGFTSIRSPHHWQHERHNPMFAYSFALLQRAKAEVRLLKGNHKGVTALEYGLIAGLIAAVIVGAVTTLGTNINGVFNNIATAMGNVTGG
jgi:pilus assembly protein Flp/PilA